MALHEFQVSVPISAIGYVTLQAEDAEQAIEMAINSVSLDDVEEWEALHQITQGNVCYALTPWKITAEDLGAVDPA